MNPSPARVLVVDSAEAARASTAASLLAEGFDAVSVDGADAARLELARGVDVVLLTPPPGEAVPLIRAIRAADPTVPIVVVSAHPDVDEAVGAMKEGASHVAQQPLAPDGVLELVRAALEQSRLRRHLGALDRRRAAGARILGATPVIEELRRLVARVAASPGSTVLVIGETGTGKDVVAHAIHDASARHEGPFVNVTCSALPDTLLESELFGHERGAFTDARRRRLGLVELARGGTLFLDEIGEMSPGLQAKLLRVLEERCFRRLGGDADVRADVRVIAATHRDLSAEVAAGRFREDLYYRLAVLEVRIPPLRERRADLRLLTEHFARWAGRELGRPVPGIDAAVWPMLEAYPWPGNVRELRNVVERAVLLVDAGPLRPADFALRTAATSPAAFALPAEGVDLGELERSLVAQALARCAGNRTQAGRLLGLNRDQIRYRIRKLGLEG